MNDLGSNNDNFIDKILGADRPKVERTAADRRQANPYVID